MTPEEMEAKILEQTEELEKLRADNKTLSENNEKLKKENEDVRTVNQKYFNKLIAQETKPENNNGDQEGDDIPSCEDFAKTLKF